MTIHASHQGIKFSIEELESGGWRWSFQPPTGKARAGQVRGEYVFALSVVRRAIEVWHLMNPAHQDEAA